MTARERAAEADERAGNAASGRLALTVLFELTESGFDDFHARVRENAAASIACEQGCLRFDILLPLDPARRATVLLYEIYADRAAFDLHLLSDHYRLFDTQTRGLVLAKTVSTFAVAENAKLPPVQGDVPGA